MRGSGVLGRLGPFPLVSGRPGPWGSGTFLMPLCQAGKSLGSTDDIFHGTLEKPMVERSTPLPILLHGHEVPTYRTVFPLWSQRGPQGDPQLLRVCCLQPC